MITSHAHRARHIIRVPPRVMIVTRGVRTTIDDCICRRTGSKFAPGYCVLLIAASRYATNRIPRVFSLTPSINSSKILTSSADADSASG
jgi:hypothetical protein